MTRRLLVTGATGCVGRAVVSQALARGWLVRGLARNEPAAPIAGLDLWRGTVEDDDAVARAVEGCAAVVHLAAYVHQVPRTDADRATLQRSIVGGSRTVAARARAAGARLVAASTVAVYGVAPPGTCSEETPPRPETPYARAKLDAEQAIAALDSTATSLRIALVYGPHDRGNVVTMLRAVDRGLGVVVGGGQNRKAVVFVQNLADRIALLLDGPGVPGAWIAADDPPPTQCELVGSLARALGRRPPLHLPIGPLLAAGAAIDLAARIVGAGSRSWHDRVRKLGASTEFHGRALDARLGYRPRVSLDEGIQLTVDWHRRHARA